MSSRLVSIRCPISGCCVLGKLGAFPIVSSSLGRWNGDFLLSFSSAHINALVKDFSEGAAVTCSDLQAARYWKRKYERYLHNAPALQQSKITSTSECVSSLRSFSAVCHAISLRVWSC